MTARRTRLEIYACRQSFKRHLQFEDKQGMLNLPLKTRRLNLPEDTFTFDTLSFEF